MNLLAKYWTLRRCSLLFMTVALLSALYVFNIVTPPLLTQDTDYETDVEPLSWSPSPPGQYLVQSPSCHVPSLDSYTSKLRTMKLVYHVELPPCAKVAALSSVRLEVLGGSPSPLPSHESFGNASLLRSRWTFVLRINASLMKKHRPAVAYCCFSSITRVSAPSSALEPPYDPDMDNRYRIGPCENMTGEEVSLDPELEFVKVRCLSRSRGHPVEVYSNMHAVPSAKKCVMRKLHEQDRLSNQEKKSRLSVLIVAIDSVSRLNFLRAFPRTASLLTANSWTDLAGYNKIGDNTLPNLMAILTGKSLVDIRRECFQHQYQPFDSCPILWRNFSRHGYVTAYAEDEPAISSWNYHKAGFRQVPTDYYLRPFMLAATNDLNVTRRDSLALCLGPQLAAEHILQYASNIASLYKEHDYLGLFWMNSFSHNNVNTPSALDNRMFRFWRELLLSGALNKTVAIFLSDHGMRSGKYRIMSPTASYEERLPFIYIHLPEAFEKANPDASAALRINGKRLTTPWDLHITLADILKRSTTKVLKDDPISLEAPACPHCRSLLTPVQFDRRCDMVNITPHYCTCFQYKDVSVDDPIVKKGVAFLISSVHSIISQHKQHVKSGYKCAVYKLDKILSARSHSTNVRSLSPSANDAVSVSHNVTYYLITIKVTPLQAVFEATLHYSDGQFRIDTRTEISRLTPYYGNGHCTTFDYLKLYCSCVK